MSVAASSYHGLALVSDGRPLLLRPPVGGQAYSGSEFVLRGEAVGTQPLSYQWLHDGTIIPGATNSVLVLADFQTSATGNYQLTVSNVLGSTTSVPAPVDLVTGQPVLLSVSTNETFYFGARSSINPPVVGSGPIAFQWYFNGTNLLGATNNELSFAQARLTNAGVYSFVASNSFGMISSPSITVRVLGPVVAWGASGQTNVPSDLTNVIAVAAGLYHTLALRADGTVAAWGHYGESTSRTNVPPGLSNVVEIAAGSRSLALRSDGTVVAWGTSNTNAFAALTNVVAIEDDLHDSTVLRADGSVVRVGVGDVSGVTSWVALARFDDNFIGLRANGTLYFSGTTLHPQNVTNVIAVSAARYHGLFLRRDGSALGWGHLPPNTLPEPAPGMIDVAASSFAKWGITTSGTVRFFGGSDATTNMPHHLTSASVIDAGNTHVVALLTDREFPLISLVEATDTSELVVSSKGSPQWFGQKKVTYDGVDAAQSAEIGSNTASSMRMFVVGPTKVRFWWKVSSRTNCHYLTFSARGVPLAAISGETDWQEYTFNVPAGPHLLTWTYSKDGSDSAGLDAAWVDQIQVLPYPPSISTHPVSQNVLSGSNVTLWASVSGTGPMTFSWLKDGVPMPNRVSSSLNLNKVTRADSGVYTLVVTNIAGSATSSNAVLKVIAPQLLQSPSIQEGALILSSGDLGSGLLSPSDLSAFEVQFSTNLLDWGILPDSLSLSNGSLLLRDPGYTDDPARFYRILERW